MNEDEQHLNLLSVFQYAAGGLLAFFASFSILYSIFGIVMITSPELMAPEGPRPPPIMGWMLAVVGGGMLLTGWLLAGLVIATGRFLKQRRHYQFCLVIACIECLFMPIGTALGVFTIIVLSRDNVKAMFNTPEEDRLFESTFMENLTHLLVDRLNSPFARKMIEIDQSK